MKGLVLAGGRGTRLRPLTFTRAKQLVPIANKPAIYYAIEDLAAAGIIDVGIVVGDSECEIKQSLQTGGRFGVRFTFIRQEAPLGIAHAVQCARDFVGSEPFVVYLGDNLLAGGIKHVVDDYHSGAQHAHVMLSPVDNPSAFGVAVVDDQGAILRLVEKPSQPPSNLALVGIYLFTPEVFDVIAMLRPSDRGELEITEAISGLLARRSPVKAHYVKGWWKDTGKPEDLLEANRLVLSGFSGRIAGELKDSRASGVVVVAASAQISGSEIYGPVVIDENAQVHNSTLGPYVAVGRGVRIDGCSVEDAVVMADSVLERVPHKISGSLVGQAARVVGGHEQSGTVRLVLGDASRVEFED